MSDECEECGAEIPKKTGGVIDDIMLCDACFEGTTDAE